MTEENRDEESGRQMTQPPATGQGNGFAWSSLICGIVGLVLAGVISPWAFISMSMSRTFGGSDRSYFFPEFFFPFLLCFILGGIAIAFAWIFLKKHPSKKAVSIWGLALGILVILVSGLGILSSI